MIACFAGITRAEADEKRRALGDAEGMAETKLWFFPRALGRGYPLPVVERVWEVLAAFASFGFCKAHAAAFALPTFQSAWLKAHWPAHFLAGVLTHDPGMYPKRLILDDARQCGITVLGLDVNASGREYLVERLPDEVIDEGADEGEPHAIRLALAEVKGINDTEVARILANRPYHSLTDFWHRARVSRPVVERLVLTGAFDRLYDIGVDPEDRGPATRRDLLLQVMELDRYARSLDRAARGRGLGSRRRTSPPRTEPVARAAARNSTDPLDREAAPADRAARAGRRRGVGAGQRPVAGDPARRCGRVGPAHPRPRRPAGGGRDPSGLPEMTAEERMRAELEILGLDVSSHVVDRYAEFLDELGVTRSRDLLQRRSRPSCWSRASRSPPRPRRSAPAAGSSS